MRFRTRKLKPKILTIKKLQKLHFKYKWIHKRNRIVGFVLWTSGVIFVLIVGIILLSNIPSINITYNFLNKFSDSIVEWTEKDLDGKTNILIIWRWWWDHDAPNLTDTIMFGSINFSSNTISLLSIPRDLYIESPLWWEWKINEVFHYWLLKTWEEDKAIKILGQKIKQITGENIHYYVDIDFAWFRHIINSIWWITVDVPEEIIDESYPDWKLWYETFAVKKWVQDMNGELALKYSRSRYTTSDFDRSKRQQIVINAIKDKLSSLGFLTSPAKIKWLYLAVKESIKTDLTLPEIVNLAFFAKDLPRKNLLSYNLNDSCFQWDEVCGIWWFLYTPRRIDFDNLSVLLPYWADKKHLSNFDYTQRFSNLIFNHPQLYLENPMIHIYNTTWIPKLALNYALNLKKYGFNIPEVDSISNLSRLQFDKSKIFYNWLPDDSKTLEALRLFIFWWTEKSENARYTVDQNVRVEIIIWNDYKYLIY